MVELKNNNFIILRDWKKFILSLEKLLVTFPKKDILTRNMIYNDCLSTLEIIIKANYENNLELKKRYKIEALAKINKIDFYLERAYYLKYISERQCINKSNELLKINKMLYAWCKNE